MVACINLVGDNYVKNKQINPSKIAHWSAHILREKAICFDQNQVVNSLLRSFQNSAAFVGVVTNKLPRYLISLIR